MKRVIIKRSNRLRSLGLLPLICLAVAAACDRPDYTYSESVPIRGTGTGASTGFPGAGGGPVAGVPPVNPCALDRSGGTPAFAGQAISDALPIRSEAYLQLTDDEVATLKETRTLVPKPPVLLTSPLSTLLVQVASRASMAESTLIAEIQARFRWTRTTWPNPWALRVVEHPATEHMNPVRIAFKSDAWFVRIVDRKVSVVDGNNAPIALEAANTTPERIAAVYYTTREPSQNIGTVCGTGHRELALGNEAMVESFSIGTKEILARIDTDLEAFTKLFQAARPCTGADIDKDGVTFGTYTTCKTWQYFDALTEYNAYAWSLSTPLEAYKPSAQNISSLMEALKADRFTPDPFVATPNPVPDPLIVAGAGGTSGAGGTGGAGGSGGMAGGSGGAGGSAGGAQAGAGDGGAGDGGAGP